MARDEYRALFDAIDEAITVVEPIFDSDGKCVDFIWGPSNPAVFRMTGLRDVEGKRAYEIVSYIEPEWLERYGRVAKSGEPERFEYPVESLGRWLSAYVSRVGSEDSRRIVVIYSDITARKQADAALRESEERHRLLIDSWAQAVWETDPAGVAVADSPSWRAYTGQYLHEWLGYGWLNAIHPDDRPHAERQWREGTAARRPVDAEFRLRASGGGWCWTNVRAAPVLDANGEIKKWVGMNIDIDARKRAEAALLESEERYRGVFVSIDEGFVEMEMVIGDAGQVVDWRWIDFNPAFERMSGLKGKKGQLFSEVVPDLEPEWAERYGHVIATGETLRFELPVGGLDSWFDAFVSRVGGEGTRRLVVVFNNITARKQAETALRKSEERQAFLLKLSDMLRSLGDAEAIKNAATRALGEHLEVDRAMYGDLDAETDDLCISGLYCRPGISPIPLRFPVAEFGPAAARLRTGELLDIPNTRDAPDQPQPVRDGFLAMGIGATLGVPLIKAGRWVSTIGLHTTGARAWTESDAMLLRETGERTWAAVERARAEAALRASEERQRLTVELVPALLWSADSQGQEVTLNERWLAYTGQTEADTQTYGWLDAIHPDDLPAARTAFEHAFATGEPLERQHRIHKASGGYRWHFVRQVPVRDEHGQITRWFGAAVDIHDGKLAEAALRASEERFAQFAKASSAGLWIRNAKTLAMEFVSPAIGTIYGVETDAFLGDMQNWAAMILPEDCEVALEHIAQARGGASVVHEFRIQRPSDSSFRWVRNTDFPIGGNGHPERVGGIAEDVTEQKLAVEHQSVLLLELQHRVRNIMAIIRSIVARTQDGASSVTEYAGLLSGRLLALARVQALLTRAASAKVGLAALVHDELVALAAHTGQFDVVGPDVELSPKAAETMTLAIHELATNALKYGALSSRNGVVTVRWEVIDKRGTPWLTFRWTEAGAPPPPASAGSRRVGFGSELIEGRIPYELRGRGKVTIEPSGARCELEFPLKDGASVLETDAPKLATVFGGAIDMSGQPDLSGQHVLVLEDDYYIATYTARALRGAGAEVLGPYATEDDARDAIAEAVPTCAVVDINLGMGPSFALAGELKQYGVPFVFITGYDQEVIPIEFAGVTRLQKPVQFKEIVGALDATIGRAR